MRVAEGPDAVDAGAALRDRAPSPRSPRPPTLGAPRQDRFAHGPPGGGPQTARALDVGVEKPHVGGRWEQERNFPVSGKSSRNEVVRKRHV